MPHESNDSFDHIIENKGHGNIVSFHITRIYK